jgi:hypothetical protein
VIELLELAADALGSIVNEVVFVGGATIPVWVTSPIVPALRATEDVDAVSEAVSYAAFAELEERLRAQGLRNDPSVICRWQQPQTGLVLDVMPADAAALGFTNRWYPAVLAERVEHELPSQRRVFVAPPVLLVATKLDAWRGRGGGDLLASRDAEDLVRLVDGRDALVDEITASSAEVREAIGRGVAGILAHRDSDYLLEGALAGYGAAARLRADRAADRLRQIAEPTS